MHWKLIAIGCGLGLLLTGASAQAQTITPQQADEMLRELRAIRELLQRMTPPAAAPAPAAPADRPAKLDRIAGYMLGRPDAPLTMVEFSDLQCTFCNRFATTTFEQVRKHWIDTGKLRYLSRDFPLDFHPLAQRAARAARCAGEQGRYWELRTELVRNASRLSNDFISEAAGTLKLDLSAFAACVESTRHDADIGQDMRDGSAAGVEGTPSFVVGRTTAQGLDGVLLVGALPYAAFDQKLKDLLAGAATPGQGGPTTR